MWKGKNLNHMFGSFQKDVLKNFGIKELKIFWEIIKNNCLMKHEKKGNFQTELLSFFFNKKKEFNSFKTFLKRVDKWSLSGEIFHFNNTPLNVGNVNITLYFN